MAMDSKGKTNTGYAAARMREGNGNAHNRGDHHLSEVYTAPMLKRKPLLSSVVGILALSSGAAGAQVLGEQTTMLTAYVTEQATLSLPSRASTVTLSSGKKGLAGSVGVKSHRGAEDFRNFRVTWSWLTFDTKGKAAHVVSRRALLPLSGSVDVGSNLAVPAADSPADSVRVKVESFEL